MINGRLGVVEAASRSDQTSTLEAHNELLRTQAQGGAHACDAACDGEAVDNVTDPAPGHLPKQREEGGPVGEGQIVAIREDTQYDGGERVHNPTVNSPMIKGDVDGIRRQLIVVQVAGPRVAVRARLLQVVIHRLGNTEVEKTDGHTGTENHHEEIRVVELEFVCVLAKLHLAEEEIDTDDEEEPKTVGSDVCPSEPRGHSRLGRTELCLGPLRIHHAGNGDAPEQERATYGNG